MTSLFSMLISMPLCECSVFSLERCFRGWDWNFCEKNSAIAHSQFFLQQTICIQLEIVQIYAVFHPAFQHLGAPSNKFHILGLATSVHCLLPVSIFTDRKPECYCSLPCLRPCRLFLRCTSDQYIPIIWFSSSPSLHNVLVYFFVSLACFHIMCLVFFTSPLLSQSSSTSSNAALIHNIIITAESVTSCLLSCPVESSNIGRKPSSRVSYVISSRKGLRSAGDRRHTPSTPTVIWNVVSISSLLSTTEFDAWDPYLVYFFLLLACFIVVFTLFQLSSFVKVPGLDQAYPGMFLVCLFAQSHLLFYFLNHEWHHWKSSLESRLLKTETEWSLVPIPNSVRALWYLY